MTNEAVPVEGPYEVHDFTVTAGTAIDKGTICMLSGTRTAFKSAGLDVFAGIATTDKSATDDTSTELGLATSGIWKCRTAGGTVISIGELVRLSGANLVDGDVTEAMMILGKVVGKSLGPVTAAGTPTDIEVDIGRTN